MSAKGRKGWKWAAEYLKKHCLQKGWRDGCKMNASGAKNANFCNFPHFGAQNAILALFAVLSAKERKSILGYFWLQKRAQMLMFSTVWRSGWKRWIFVKKLLFGVERTIKKLFLARHKNIELYQKWGNMIFTHFGQKRKTLYKRNVSGTLFRPESQKSDFSTFGSKKVKMS